MENNYDEIEQLKKRKYKLDKTKDIMAMLCCISIAFNVGSCTIVNKNNTSVYTYSLGSMIGSFCAMSYCTEESKKCSDKIKSLS